MAAARARLSDVAERAGVSQKTVSNVLHNHPHVTARTREKVEDALRELNYQVNLSARSLASGRTGFIALAVPGLDNPYFAQLAAKVIAAAGKYGWTVLIEQTGGAGDSESQVIAGATPYLVDGIVLHPEALEAGDLVQRPDQTPIVLVGEKALDHVADHVAADNVAAARALTEHLLEAGRRRIAVVGMQENSAFTTSALRFDGYAAALSAADIPIDPTLVVPTRHFDRATGAALAGRLAGMAAPPDAVICFNDVLAVGMLHGLLSAGLRVPDDIAVAGFDAIDEAAFTTPPLTSVAWDTSAIAEQALALLAARGADDDRPQQEIAVGFELVVRESTAFSAAR